jgi:hypothetical protein
LKSTISYDDYLKLVGLLAIAQSHNKQVRILVRVARSLTPDLDCGHTDDAAWCDETAEELLRKLDIAILPAEEARGMNTIPLPSPRQPQLPMRPIERLRRFRAGFPSDNLGSEVAAIVATLPAYCPVCEIWYQPELAPNCPECEERETLRQAFILIRGQEEKIGILHRRGWWMLGLCLGTVAFVLATFGRG